MDSITNLEDRYALEVQIGEYGQVCSLNVIPWKRIIKMIKVIRMIKVIKVIRMLIKVIRMLIKVIRMIKYFIN